MANLYVNFLDGGKSNEESIFRLFNKIAGANNAGIVGTGDFLVEENGTPDMDILIAVGDIVIPYQGYFFHGFSTLEQTLTVSANASGNPRIDAVVAYVDLTTAPSSAVTNNLDYLVLDIIEGTPAGSPAAPNDAAIQSAIGASNVFHRLANIAVANGATSITNANITDTRETFVLGVGPDTVNTMTNKIMSKLVAVNEHDNGNSGTSKAINWANGDRQKVTLTGNCTFTFSNATEGQYLTLWLVQDGTGGRTITLPTIRWPGGSAPTFSTGVGAIDCIVVRYDGSNYYGQFAIGFA